MNYTEIFKNDDVNAFGRRFVRIIVPDADRYTISKAMISCGDFTKTYLNPTFPLDVDLCAEETRNLRFSTYWYIAIFDEYGRKHTFKEAFCVRANDEKVPSGNGNSVTNAEAVTNDAVIGTVEVTNDITIPLQEITIEFGISPEKMSELEDDMNIESRFSVLTNEINTLKSSEDTEMTDIVALIERRTENMVNFLDE